MTASVPLEVAPSAFAGPARRRPPGHDPAGRHLRPHVGRGDAGLREGRAPAALDHGPRAAGSAGGARPRLLVALDIALLGDLGGTSDAERVLTPVREALGLEPGELLVNCSHTHSAPWAAMSRSHMPGGELIGPYLDQLSAAILEAGRGGDRAASPRRR